MGQSTAVDGQEVSIAPNGGVDCPCRDLFSSFSITL